MSNTTKEQRKELKQHMEWMARRYELMARRYDRHTANKYFLALLNDLEAAEAEIARLREQTHWRPIETAPKDVTKILGYIPSDYGVEVVWFSDFDRTWHSYRGAGVRPTKWMPLPPQEGESGKC